MKLPIRNHTTERLTLFIEPQCDEYEIPAGGEAIVQLQDGRPHSIDVHPDGFVALWDEGIDPPATVQIFSDQEHPRARPLDSSTLVSKRPVVLLVAGIIILLAAGYGTFYSALAVGVSDGRGHLTAQIMLAACFTALLSALFLIIRSTLKLVARP